MKELWRKNIRVLTKEHRSYLLLGILPLMLLLLVSINLDQAPLRNLRVGLDADFDNATRMLLSEQFIVTSILTSQECEEKVLEDELDACLFAGERLQLYLDYRRFSISDELQKEINQLLFAQQQQEAQQQQQSMQTKSGLLVQSIGEREKTLMSLAGALSAQGQSVQELGSMLRSTNLFRAVTAEQYALTLDSVTASLQLQAQELSSASANLSEVREIAEDAGLSSHEEEAIFLALNNSERIVSAANASLLVQADLLNELVSLIKDDPQAYEEMKDSAEKVQGLLRQIELNQQELLDKMVALQQQISQDRKLLAVEVDEARSLEVLPVFGSAEQTRKDLHTFPRVLVILLLLAGLLIPTLLTSDNEREKLQLRFSRVHMSKILLANALASWCVLAGVILILLTFSIMLLQFPVQTLVPLLLLYFLFGALWVLLGAMLAEVYRSTHVSGVLATIIAGIVLFFSHVMVRPQFRWAVLESIARLNPLTLTYDLTGSMLYFNIPLSTMLIDIAILASYVLEALVLMLIVGVYLHHRSFRSEDI